MFKEFDLTGEKRGDWRKEPAHSSSPGAMGRTLHRYCRSLLNRPAGDLSSAGTKNFPFFEKGDTQKQKPDPLESEIWLRRRVMNSSLNIDK
ncbi:MAG TPA: hypothetical protein PK054_09415 [Anaerohalosphaeraceae bacterium]|nr:hypothetical protein [Anaerohalosphaeraceae bacterium]HOL89341.1 hypothetical protein [Anaerohalosphaeraceae bacterium]HPP56780.1 hypothetical protein [Anaerohalosphaeraceae bacterium]